MAHVRSTARPRYDAPTQEGEGVAVERDVSSKSHDSAGSVGGSWSVHASDTGSRSNAEGNSDRGSYSYNFSPLMVTVSRIRELIEQGYFDEGGAHTPREETIAEQENDEAVRP
jgi:hypothetical protein